MKRAGAKNPQKVLVHLIGSLGDTIVAIPALRAIRRHFAGAEIVLLQNEHSPGIVSADQVLPHGLVDRSLSYSSSTSGLERYSGFLGLWRAVRRDRFDAAVSLVISERPAAAMLRDRWFFRSCGIGTLYGFHAFTPEYLYPRVDGRPAMTPAESSRKLARLMKDGIASGPADSLAPFYSFAPNDVDRVRSWLATRRRVPGAPLVALAPGCKTQANQWPFENFAELARSITAEHRCELIIVGGPGERQAAHEIVESIGTGIPAAGEFSVRDSALLLAQCDLYIGLDTGSTHLAAAVGTPFVAIFGERNNPGHWYPIGAPGSLLRHPVPCSGCRLFECPVPGHPCMQGISIASVRSAVEQSLVNRTERRPGVTVVKV